MMPALIGLALGFAIGFGCRWFDLPLPYSVVHRSGTRHQRAGVKTHPNSSARW